MPRRRVRVSPRPSLLTRSATLSEWTSFSADSLTALVPNVDCTDCARLDLAYDSVDVGIE